MKKVTKKDMKMLKNIEQGHAYLTYAEEVETITAIAEKYKLDSMELMQTANIEYTDTLKEIFTTVDDLPQFIDTFRNVDFNQEYCAFDEAYNEYIEINDHYTQAYAENVIYILENEKGA